ncbi:MAG: hypothetical protein JWM93_3543 [Frankiales bacterium]|nr:hypothetical protein [Frankiales bacterium]
MNLKRRSWRPIVGIVTAGLIAGGLSAVPAHAAGGPNLAAGRTTAESGHTQTFVAANVADGNQATYWEGPASYPSWVQVDLGAATSIDQVILKLPTAWGNRTQTLSILGSSDGASFSTLVASGSRTFTSGSNTVPIGFTAATTRFVRVNFTANTGSAGGQLSSLEVYGTSGGSPNLAVGKAMTTSGATQTYVAGNANDSNQATYWEGTPNAYPNWLRVDLGSATAINRVVLKLPVAWGARTETLSVQGSTDGTTFTDLVAPVSAQFAPASANTLTFNFTAATQRYVRVNITANTGSTGGQISEFEVYAPSCAGDCTAPTAPSNLNGTTSSTTVNLTWSAAADTVGVTGYDVFANGSLRASLGNVTSFADTNQPTSATIDYTVRARDAAGNVSPFSNTFHRAGAGDTTAPSVPANLTGSASGTTSTLNWSASTDNTGGSGMAGYDVWKNGAFLKSVGNVTTTTDACSGSTSYTVRARDVAGNISADSNTVTVACSPPVDSTPPSVPANLSGSTSGTTVTLNWSASTDNAGGSGMAGYNVFANGTQLATVGNVTTYQATNVATTANVDYTVKARDVTGNLSAASNVWTHVGQTVGCSTPADQAAGDSISANTTTLSFVAANANDGNLNTYWEGAGYPSTLTVAMGSNVNISSVVVKLNPATSWGTRTQTIEVLGRDQAGTTFAQLKAPTLYTFTSGTNVVTIPVSATAADLRINITTNSGAGGGQVAELQVMGCPAPNPDLTVSGVTTSPANPNETTAITLTATVSNTGTATAGATNVNFYLGGTKVGTAPVASLAAGASVTVSADAGVQPMGSYIPSVRADEPSVVIEQSETNNSGTGASITVAQAPGPDLRVLSISPNPQSPAAGAPVSFVVAVNNRGTTAVAAGTTTRVVAGASTLTATTPAIAAGATVNVTVGTWTAVAGGATITATADATGTVAETSEANNSLSQSIVVGRGAALPYVEYEAEAAAYQGTLLTTDPLRTFGHTNFATESSGRQSVRLNSTGQFVEFTSTSATNSIVVRNSIPDAPAGGGQDATISLYINGTFAQKLTLSSKHSWLYGTTDQPEGLTNTPGGEARRLFDESNALLSASYPSGTTFRLQRDASDTAAFYIIDLIDLEQVAAPIAKPAECVSITAYGAVPNDNGDDTAAIQAAVTADQNGQIPCVWIPVGRWRQEQKILTDDPLNRGQWNQVGISNVTIRGAGMWYSVFFTQTLPQDVVGGINHPHEGNFGFDIDNNTQISDIAIFGSGTIRGGDGNAEGGVGLNGRFGVGTKISNVWIEHANVAVWVGRDYDNIQALWGPADGLEFTGMRIRDTYADGINFTNGTSNSRVFNSSFRTQGDDAMAVWSNTAVKDRNTDGTDNNHFVNNTVQLPWRANGIAIYGGADNSIESNLIYDTMNYPGIMLATDHSPLPFSGTTLIANNGLYRTGGAFWNEDQEFGAITLFPSTLPIVGVTIRDTDIFDSTYDGIQFKNGGGRMDDVRVTNVRIDKSNNGAGVLAMSGAQGNAILSNVTVTNSAKGDVVTQPGSQFIITRS